MSADGPNKYILVEAGQDFFEIPNRFVPDPLIYTLEDRTLMLARVVELMSGLKRGGKDEV